MHFRYILWRYSLGNAETTFGGFDDCAAAITVLLE